MGCYPRARHGCRWLRDVDFASAITNSTPETENGGTGDLGLTLLGNFDSSDLGVRVTFLLILAILTSRVG